MQHVRVAKCRITSGDISEVADMARDGMLKVFKDHTGFISYGLADCGDGTGLSISHWETHHEAEAAAGFAREWVATNSPTASSCSTTSRRTTSSSTEVSLAPGPRARSVPRGQRPQAIFPH
jgi:hypothetical protein